MICTDVTRTNSVNTRGCTVPTSPVAVNWAVTVGSVTLEPPEMVVLGFRKVSM